MTISSSLNAGVAGLSANASRLAAISDNIANASTNGYKRVQTDFHSMALANSGGSYTAGGVRTTSTRLVEQNGSIVSTGSGTDIAVQDRGLIPVANLTAVEGGDETPQMLLTATGSFTTDSNGYLKTTSGLVLMGWELGEDGTLPAVARGNSDSLTPVQITKQPAAFPTTQITMGVTLPAAQTEAGAAGDDQVTTIEYIDNLGKRQNLTATFSPTVPATGSSNTWTLALDDAASTPARVGEYDIVFNDSRAAGGTIASVATTTGGAYDAGTGSVIVTLDSGPVEIFVGELNDTGGPMKQLSYDFQTSAITKDGSQAAQIQTYEIDSGGFVVATYDTGASRKLFQIPIVDVPNPNGLTAMDRQTFAPSADSGAYYLWDAGDGPVGEMVPFGLSESTTDVAGELTSMIQTQRAYSSNAKVIQTVDEMLQETTNIIR
ncbi:flagellar hook protein FlgE [Chachezhania antarctica]|uniref:flagellar hook protein FlgE n=1 Tax=Chachezhania antarctica TaxID=2340860 RepID=UPI000EAF63B9|nr:flagellar hook-basal body complex protein [Chachezhania antarctica]|tara:strand:+ start:12387 stop:13688 length:1302 start_codon:yes stop_codon:yes gene_type:complete